MLSSKLCSRLVPPVATLCNVSSTRTLRSFPYYKNIADGDREADLKFDIEYGIKPDPPSVEEMDPTNKPNFITRLCTDVPFKIRKTVNSFFGEELPYMQSEAEKAERVILMDRLHEMYATIPQRYPKKEWYEDFLAHCVKYNDYNAVMMMYDWLLDNKMNIDNDVLAKFEQIRYQNLPVSLFDKSPWRKERDQLEHMPDSDPEALWLRRHGPMWETEKLEEQPVYQGSKREWTSKWLKD